jgi:aryl-alcohol dehydrogenase-like predicted oxidoreductase
VTESSSPSSTTIPRTTLAGGIEVSRIGLGAMVLTRSYAEVDAAESLATLERALARGVTLVDTADSYGGGENEQFLGEHLGGRRNGLVLSSKFGLSPQADGTIRVDGRPDYVRACCDASLRRLRVDHLDLYYQHRVAPDVPIEETVGAMAGLVEAGKVRTLGLCEPTADELRRAATVHPIAAVQSEWSLWARQIEAEVLPVARALGAGVVAYAPLGRGFLAGAVTSAPAAGDLRAPDPRLHGANLTTNLELVQRLRRLAARKQASLAQLALAWLLAQGTDVVPIPGNERREFLDDNLGALDVELDAGDLSELDAMFPPGVAAGDPDETLLRVRKAPT